MSFDFDKDKDLEYMLDLQKEYIYLKSKDALKEFRKKGSDYIGAGFER